MSNRHKIFVSYHRALESTKQPDNSRSSLGKSRRGIEWTD